MEEVKIEEDKAGAAEAAEDKLDDQMLQNTNNILENTKENQFSVINPKLSGNHIVYQCGGVDSEGTWTGERRFKEFAALHEKLEEHWPGIPIPQLPSKRRMGNNMESKFVN